MKVIKKVNHNAAVCVDCFGNELIAFGKGIGFPQVPYEVELNKIERTYYNVNPSYYALFKEIPDEIFEISMVLVDYAKKKLMVELNPNLLFTLADHINFTVNRYHNNIQFKVPFTMDVAYFYEKEITIGKKAIEYINKKLKIHLSDNEAVGITLHLINSEMKNQIIDQKVQDEEIINHITQIVENRFSLKIDKKSFNYSRFVSHLYYLLQRNNHQQIDQSDNIKIFNEVKDKNPLTFECTLDIKNYIDLQLKWNLNDEELLYLMLHINRLCAREKCDK